MAIEHANITDPDIHEPKGASTALSGQIQVADGSGGTTWTDQLGLQNFEVVSDANDLPTPVGGLIPLSDFTTYRVSGELDLGGNRLILGEGTILEGSNSAVDKVTTTTTQSLISGTQCRIRDLTLNAPAGQVFDIVGTFTDTVLIDSVRIQEASAIGTFSGCALFRFNSFTVVLTTGSGMTFSGACGSLRMSDCSLRGFSGVGVDLNGATFSFVNITSSAFDNTTGTYSISLAALSGNIDPGGEGIVAGCLFQGIEPFVENYTGAETGWEFAANANVRSSVKGATGYILGSSINTSFSDTTTRVPVDFGTDWVSETTDQFTVNTSGVYIYTGQSEILVDINASVFANVSGGADRNYRYFFAKNGVIIESSVAQNLYDGSNSGACFVQGVTSVVTGDQITLAVQAVDASTNLNVETCSIKILGV